MGACILTDWLLILDEGDLSDMEHIEISTTWSFTYPESETLVCNALLFLYYFLMSSVTSKKMDLE